MEGSTAARLDTQSPMMTEPAELRSSPFALTTVAEVAPIEVCDGLNARPLLERSARQRSRPVKGRSCGVHVVSQLQSTQRTAVGNTASLQDRDKQHAGAGENCTPPDLRRTASRSEGCDSATASAQQGPNAQCTLIFHRGQGIQQSVPPCNNMGRRPRRASSGAAMVASFTPARTPELPDSTQNLNHSPSVSPRQGDPPSVAIDQNTQRARAEGCVGTAGCASVDLRVVQPTHVLLAQVQSNMDDIVTDSSKQCLNDRAENVEHKAAVGQRTDPEASSPPNYPRGELCSVPEEQCSNLQTQAVHSEVLHATVETYNMQADKQSCLYAPDEIGHTALGANEEDLVSKADLETVPLAPQGVSDAAAGAAITVYCSDDATLQHASGTCLSVQQNRATPSSRDTGRAPREASLSKRPIHSSHTHMGSASRHSAGQRAAALCLSPVNSKDTANEGGPQSAGGGSLQTMIEGDQGQKGSPQAMVGHGEDAAEDETTSPEMTPPPVSSTVNTVPGVSNKQSQPRGRGELLCAAAVAAAASRRRGGDQTRTALADVRVQARAESAAGATACSTDGHCSEERGTCVRGEVGVENASMGSPKSSSKDVEWGAKEMDVICDPAVSQRTGECGMQIKPDSADVYTAQILREDHLCTRDADGCTPAQTQELQDAQSTPPLLVTRFSAPDAQPLHITSEEGFNPRVQPSNGCVAECVNVECAGTDPVCTEDQCIVPGCTHEEVNGVVTTENQRPSGKDDTQKSFTDNAAEDDLPQQIARFSLKRRNTSLSPVAEVPAGSLRGAIEDALIVHGDRGTKRARISAGMLAVSATQGTLDPGWYLSVPRIGSDVGPAVQPVLQKSMAGARQRVTASSMGLKAVAAAAAKSGLTESCGFKDSVGEAAEAEMEQSESPCTGPSNRGSLDDLADGDSMNDDPQHVLSKEHPGSGQHAIEHCKQVADVPDTTISPEPQLKLPRKATGSTEPLIRSAPPGPRIVSGHGACNDDTTGDEPSQRIEPENSHQAQSHSCSLASPAISNCSKSQSKSQCLHDPVSAVLADATSAFLFESDGVLSRSLGTSGPTHAVAGHSEKPEVLASELNGDKGQCERPASCGQPRGIRLEGSGCAAAHCVNGAAHASESTPQLQQCKMHCAEAIASDASVAGTSGSVDDVPVLLSACVSLPRDGEWPPAGCLHSTSPLGRCSLPLMFADQEIPGTTSGVQPAITGCALASPPHCQHSDSAMAGDEHDAGKPDGPLSSPDGSAENVAPCRTRAADCGGQPADTAQEARTDTVEGRNASPPVAFGPSIPCSLRSSVRGEPEGSTVDRAREECSNDATGAHHACADMSNTKGASVTGAVKGSVVTTPVKGQDQLVACDGPLLTPPRASFVKPADGEPERNVSPLQGFPGTPVSSSRGASCPSPSFSRPFARDFVQDGLVRDSAYEAPSPCTSEAAEVATEPTHGLPTVHAEVPYQPVLTCEHAIAGDGVDCSSVPLDHRTVNDASESPPDEQQCSPPKLSSCSPPVHSGDNVSSAADANHRDCGEVEHECRTKTTSDTRSLQIMRQAATDCPAMRPCLELHASTDAAEESCQGPSRIEQRAASDCEATVTDCPDPSSVCLSEHPPGMYSPSPGADGDNSRLCPHTADASHPHHSPSRTSPPATNFGGHKMLRGTRGQLLLAAAVSTAGTPPAVQQSCSSPLLSSQSERSAGHHANAAHTCQRLGSPGNNTLSQRSPSRNTSLSSPLRHSNLIGAHHATFQTRWPTPPGACEQGTPPTDARRSSKGGSPAGTTATGLPSPLSPITASDQVLLRSSGARRHPHASAAAVLGGALRFPPTERSMDEFGGSGAGTGISTPPQQVQRKRVNVKRHGMHGTASALGLSATQICARNASGSAMSLPPGARHKPFAGQLMPTAGSAASVLAALQTAFLDLQLATEASRGADWATLTSTGVPLPDPLDISAMSAQLAIHAATAAASSAAADIATAMEDAQAEWLQLRESRIACWMRLSLPAAASSTPEAPKNHQKDGKFNQNSRSSIDPAASPTAAGASIPQHAQRRSSLKRSPLPRMCVVPQPLPEVPSAPIPAATTPSRPVSVGTGIMPHVATHSTPPLPLFHNATGREDAATTGQGNISQRSVASGEESPVKLWSGGDGDTQDGGTGRHKRRRFVRFSEQAIVKRYEGKQVPSRVRGEPEVMQAVAVHSPVKCQVAARKERRGWATGSRVPSSGAGGSNVQSPGRADDELEEGEVVESRPGSSPGLDASAQGPGNVHAGILACAADGNVENESPVAGVLKTCGHCVSGVLGSSSCMMGAHTHGRHSLNDMTGTIQPHAAVEQAMCDNEGPPGDVPGGTEVC